MSVALSKRTGWILPPPLQGQSQSKLIFLFFCHIFSHLQRKKIFKWILLIILKNFCKGTHAHKWMFCEPWAKCFFLGKSIFLNRGRRKSRQIRMKSRPKMCFTSFWATDGRLLLSPSPGCNNERKYCSLSRIKLWGATETKSLSKSGRESFQLLIEHKFMARAPSIWSSKTTFPARSSFEANERKVHWTTQQADVWIFIASFGSPDFAASCVKKAICKKEKTLSDGNPWLNQTLRDTRVVSVQPVKENMKLGICMSSWLVRVACQHAHSHTKTSTAREAALVCVTGVATQAFCLFLTSSKTGKPPLSSLLKISFWFRVTSKEAEK